MATLSLPLLLKLIPLLTLAYTSLRALLYRRPPRGSIPLPGPPGLPILGNALQFPAVNPWKQLKVWADEYGPIYQISALGKTFVVLGSEEVANELLRTRGGIYSDRHYIAVLRDEIHLPIVRYGDTWRRQRKFFHFAQMQSQSHNPHYITALTQNISRTINELLFVYSTSPSPSPSAPPSPSSSPPINRTTHWHAILDAYICGTVSQLAYGQPTHSSTDVHVRTWTRFYNEFEKCAEPARYAVNVWPWLRFVPAWMGPWRKSGKAYLEEERKWILSLFEGVGRGMGINVEGWKVAEAGGKGGGGREQVGIRKQQQQQQRKTHGKDSEEWDDVSVAKAGTQPAQATTQPSANTSEDAPQEKQQSDWSIASLYWADPAKWTTPSPSTSLTAHEAAYTLGAFIEASMAGTPAALKLFVQAMLWYPEWQDRIYDEICAVCGRPEGDESPEGVRGAGQEGRSKGRRGRMPTLADSPQLPSLRAVIKETLRWRPTLPGGFPHRLMQDDLYTPLAATNTTNTTTTTTLQVQEQEQQPTYHIPASTLLLWHHYTMTRDRALYPDPEVFNPSRFLDASRYPLTAKLPSTKYPSCLFDAAFGFGRRMCPGTQQAEDMIFLAVAWLVCGAVLERREKGEGEGKGIRKGGGDGEKKEQKPALELDDLFEPVPWDEYDEGRPTRPKGFDFVMVEREGWRERLGG